MSLAAFLVIAQLSASPQALLERALDAVEPPPALRASFHARLESDEAVREISFDPFEAQGPQFRVTLVQGRDESLDAVVDAWRAEKQADARLFADALRASLEDVRILGGGQQVAVQFRHRISPKDGAVGALISSSMTGQLDFNPASGRLDRIAYGIQAPVKLPDGTTLTEYTQSYLFGHSARWRVSFVTAYNVRARGGKWGVKGTRTLRVTLTDVTFGLAGDARQVLASRG